MGRQCSKEMSGFIRMLSILLIFASGGLIFGCSGSTSNDSASGASLDHLVVYGTVDDKMLEVIKTNFKTTVTAIKTPEFQSGRDVLLIDARQQDPKMITNESHVFRTAYDAGIPIMVLHMDDEFEGAVHKLLPSLLISGYTGLALIIPPRAGMDASDGAILQATKDEEEDQSWEVSQSVVETMIDEMKKIYQTRESKKALILKSSLSDDDKCSADDPYYCSLVKRVSLSRITIIRDYKSSNHCLTTDWQYTSSVSGDPDMNYLTIILQLAPIHTSVYTPPQCPNQVYNFYPVLYLNNPINGAPSRVLMMKMDALLSPGTITKRDTDAAFWYQSMFEISLTPSVLSNSGPTQNGIIWLANLPHSANSSHEVTDSTEWGLDVSGKASKDDYGEIGGHVNFTHEVTNHLDDWKFVDYSSQTFSNSYWKFQAIQTYPYSADGRGNLCDGNVMGNIVSWLFGINCGEPLLIHGDYVPDLSYSSSNISGLAVWDLGSSNNDSTTAKFTFSTMTQFDAAGCKRWSKNTHYNINDVNNRIGKIAPPADIGDFDCKFAGYWLDRIRMYYTKTFYMSLDNLPIPAK